MVLLVHLRSLVQKYRLHVRKLPAGSKSINTLLSTGVDVSCGDQLELGCSMDLEHSSSPKGPFHLERSRKCNSSSGEEDPEEEKSDGQSWKARHYQV